jgi:hypothetical protein
MIEIVDPKTGELMDTDSVPGLAAVAGLHDDQLYHLSAVVAQLQEDAREDGSNDVGPFVWDRLGPHDAVRLWQELADWVGWLRSRYPLARQVPLCWWRHSELVEEMTALWLAWREAYLEKGAPLTAAADWHARWLPDFLHRIGAGGWNVACEGEHKPRIGGLYDDQRVDEPREFETFVKADADRRRGGKPTREQESTMDDETMQAALDSGAAKALGELPNSPVAYDGSYWVPNETGWSLVTDEDTVAYLTDAERRLRLADDAVTRSEE